MENRHRCRATRIAVAASGFALLLASGAFAQTVKVFDDAPSIEQLRSIMIPDSKPGAGRTIVIQHRDTGSTAAANVQRVATTARPSPRVPVSAANVPQPADEEAAPAQSSQTKAQARMDTAANPGTVGFRINFGFNSAVLPVSAYVMIDRVAEVMKEAPDIKVRVEGHTDAIGAPDYNVSLSERRALSVGEYLVKLGIEPSRLMLVGKGMAEPLTNNPYDANNRRVQFVRVM